jgi:hypothetical protein
MRRDSRDALESAGSAGRRNSLGGSLAQGATGDALAWRAAGLRKRGAHGPRRPVAQGSEGTPRNVGSQQNGTLSA